ncbi:MAG: methylmalonyl-CoA mutase, partial [Deltaproteobacteria bacterium]|nr:methylmalonyl-CoA mutase [Deltaproteobacteria bacterium]
MEILEKVDNDHTISGIPLKKIYTPEDLAGLDYERDLGSPGAAPFTRGAYPNMYHDKLWRIFQLSGYGTAEDERDRILYLLEQGETGFIMESDMSTWYLYDVDHPEVLGRKDEVGQYGPPMFSMEEFEIALEGIPIEKLYCHPGGVGPPLSPFSHACYFSVARKRGIPLNKLTGTGEGDFFLFYLSNLYKDQVGPTAGHRLNCDLIEYCVENLPRWIPVSIPGYNARECNVKAHQELAMTLANAVAYMDEILQRGRLKIDDFAYAIGGVSFATGRDFFEDIAKMRASRRMWSRLLTERYGAKDPRSLRLRIHALVQGSGYTYQQPLNNIVRGAYQAMAAGLAGVQSLGVAAYDEAISTPSEGAHTMSLRTQQILQYESNITNVVDPLAGSYYVEWLTSEVEKRAWEYLDRIDQEGGFIHCLESGFFHREAVKGTMERQRKIRTGELKVIGVNCFHMEEEPHEVEVFRHNPKAWEIAMERLEGLRKKRDSD